jgi:hypothetical protein
MAAPLGNNFAIGNSGKPKEFENPQQLEAFINEYFDKIDNNPIKKLKHVTNQGIEIYDEILMPYTVEGLCLHLGVTRQTLLNYRKRKGYEEYFDVLIRAGQKITERLVSLGLIGDYDTRLVNFLLTNNAEYKNKIEETSKGEMKIKWVEEKTYPGKDEAESKTDDSD